MGIVSGLIADARKVTTAATNRYYGRIYRDRDIKRQREELEGYTTGIEEILVGSPLNTGKLAAFVYYEPQEEVSPSVMRVVDALRAADVDTLLLCNHLLTRPQLDYFEKNVHSVVLRNNQGFDFGAYKDAVKHINETHARVERVAFLNDSVFYASKGLATFIEGLFGEADVIAGYENWSEDHHLQSFALSVSNYVFESDQFQDFWRAYEPINNRIHTIEQGEKELTRALLPAARSSRVLYNTADLYNALQQSDIDLTRNLTIYPNPWRAWIEALDPATHSHDFVANKVADVVNVTSTVHSGAYLFPMLLNSPLFKKDLVYRHRFQFWEIEGWVSELLPPDEAAEFMTILRKRRDASALSDEDRRRFNLGVK